MLIVRRNLIVVLCLAVGCQSAFALSTIELANGSRLRVEVLSEKPDRIFIDLGFSILAIPRETILRIYNEKTVKEGEQFGEDLYRENEDSAELSLRELAERNSESVVLIRTAIGQGSGFVIHPEGYVVTNNHVIAGEHEISITLFDEGGKEMKRVQFNNVRIVATVSELDLALVKIEDTGSHVFKTVALGESDDLRQGQTVFAIGNPLGLDRSVSEGIVSLKNRLIGGRLFVQTTAEINRGNSGGPLFNMRGEVIGVNNMKVVAQGAEGLGFAIPSSVLKMFLSNRDTYSFDPRNPNSGYRYNRPPRQSSVSEN